VSLEEAAPAEEVAPAKEAAPARGVDRAAWRRAALCAVSTWAAAATAYLLVTALSWFIRDDQGPPLSRMLLAWDRWDTGHYLRIADVGYTPDRLDSPAFFPLYPLLIRALDVVLPGGGITAGLVVSNLACVGALALLYRFAAYEFGDRHAGRTLLYLVAWPAAFYLCAVYNTSLFLLLTVAALYCLRRGMWWAAGGLGALASATRLSGALLVVAFAVEYARQRGWTWRWRSWRWRDLRVDALAVLLVPSGLVAYALYCWQRLGDPLAFSHAQRQWGREFAPPWSGLAEAAGAAFGRPMLQPLALHNLIDLLTYVVVITLLVLCIVGPWKLPRDQVFLVAYAVVSLAVALTGPVAGLFPLQGVPRYAVELVPMFFLLGRIGENRHVERLYLLPVMAVQVMFLLTFLNGVFLT